MPHDQQRAARVHFELRTIGGTSLLLRRLISWSSLPIIPRRKGIPHTSFTLFSNAKGNSLWEAHYSASWWWLANPSIVSLRDCDWIETGSLLVLFSFCMIQPWMGGFIVFIPPVYSQFRSWLIIDEGWTGRKWRPNSLKELLKDIFNGGRASKQVSNVVFFQRQHVDRVSDFLVDPRCPNNRVYMPDGIVAFIWTGKLHCGCIFLNVTSSQWSRWVDTKIWRHGRRACYELEPC